MNNEARNTRRRRPANRSRATFSPMAEAIQNLGLDEVLLCGYASLWHDVNFGGFYVRDRLNRRHRAGSTSEGAASVLREHGGVDSFKVAKA